MKSLGGGPPEDLSAPARGETGNVDGGPAVVANERTTALAGAVLLVLVAVELATLPTLHALLSVHVFVGVLLAGPLAVKIGSTGYRFLRYYTGSPDFVRKGRPHPALRVLAPLLLASTLALIVSGIALLVGGPTHRRPLLDVHVLSFLAWLPTIVLHSVCHFRQVPRLLVDDWHPGAIGQTAGRGRRIAWMVGALASGAIAAVLLLPTAAPWIPNVGNALSKLIAGTAVTALALLAAKPLRWR